MCAYHLCFISFLFLHWCSYMLSFLHTMFLHLMFLHPMFLHFCFAFLFFVLLQSDFTSICFYSTAFTLVFLQQLFLHLMFLQFMFLHLRSLSLLRCFGCMCTFVLLALFVSVCVSLYFVHLFVNNNINYNCGMYCIYVWLFLVVVCLEFVCQSWHILFSHRWFGMSCLLLWVESKSH